MGEDDLKNVQQMGNTVWQFTCSPPRKNDAAVEHPEHYAGDGIECMDALASMMGADGLDVEPAQAFWWGNAFKYLWRWPLKNGKQDLEKAARCIEYLLETL